MNVFMPRVHFAAALAVAALSGLPATAGRIGDFNAACWGFAYLLNAAGEKTYSSALTDADPSTSVEVHAGESVLVEWNEPRDVHAVRLVFASDPVDVAVCWWYRRWPDNGAGGWMKLDDPFNGRFVTAAVERSGSARECLLTFKPLDKAEVPEAQAVGATWRSTYKIRLRLGAGARIAEVECLTDSTWKTAKLRIELPYPAPGIPGLTLERVEARNGRILSLTPEDERAAVVEVKYADNPERLSPDRGYVVVRTSGTDFSFFVDDVLRDGVIWVRDLNAYISDASRNLSSRDLKRPAGSWAKPVMERVQDMPEQTFENAMRTIPRKWIDHAHMGLPILRQEASINYSACPYTYSKSLRGIGSDVDRSPQFPEEWSAREFTLVTNKTSVGPPGPKRIKRYLEDGYLPIVHSEWNEEGIDYHQTIFVTALDQAVLKQSLAPPAPPPVPMGRGEKAADYGIGPRGDEPIAAMMRLEMSNRGEQEQTAYLWLKPKPMPPMSISIDGLLILDKPTKPSVGADFTPCWGQIVTFGRGELSYLKAFLPEGAQAKDARDVIRYSVTLKPGEKHSVLFKMPYIEQMSPRELDQLKALEWDSSYREVKDLWNKRLERSISDYHVPQPELENLWRANLWHVLIGTDRDPSTGLYEHGAGTYAYPMYANEAMMVARSLDMRGEHEEARRLIEPYIVSQGQRALPGNFKSKDGLLYAAAPAKYDQYTAQGYNMHHGFILWAAAEHYLFTRDRAYLEAIAPNLIAACDWITRERQATKVMNPDGSRPVEYGLAPAGDLEDVDEYLYFYATNAYYYLGMKTAAEALADIGHPEARRLRADAQAYRDDILASVRESVATSPVVRLLDGSYVPYVPPRAYALTDQKEGWIREALYCALHLVDAGLIHYQDNMASWILHDLEDRIFFSDVSGQPPEKMKMTLDEYWFTFGGYNPQPNLLDNAIAYLKRNQSANFVRAFMNIYSASIYPDTVCFSECVPPFAAGGGPVYKTPDESKFIQYMRQMLILEMGNELAVGRGIPRAWMEDGRIVELRDAPTYFGPMSVKYESHADSGIIKAQISLPSRNPAERALISFRHPKARPIKSVTVNGRPWFDFDPTSGEVSVPGSWRDVTVTASY